MSVMQHRKQKHYISHVGFVKSLKIITLFIDYKKYLLKYSSPPFVQFIMNDFDHNIFMGDRHIVSNRVPPANHLH